MYRNVNGALNSENNTYFEKVRLALFMCWFYVVAYFMCGAVNKCAPRALKKVRFCSLFVRLVIKNGEHVHNTSTFVANLIQPVLFYMQSHFFIYVRQPLGTPQAAVMRAPSIIYS